MQLTIKVNGEDWTVEAAPADVLLDVLREQLGVKSPKIGCERGDCGSCTIILDERTALRGAARFAFERLEAEGRARRTTGNERRR